MRAKPALFIAGALLFAGCGGGNYLKGDGPPSGSTRIPDLPDDPVPRPESRSKYGNGPVYEVLGKRYTVMESSRNYHERGVASWYGKKFHGNLTSNREVYDMYAMTAAHKSLPLPTYVRVRNLSKARRGAGGGTGSQEARYCTCRKGPAGFMLQCELCKDWFHSE